MSLIFLKLYVCKAQGYHTKWPSRKPIIFTTVKSKRTGTSKEFWRYAISSVPVLGRAYLDKPNIHCLASTVHMCSWPGNLGLAGAKAFRFSDRDPRMAMDSAKPHQRFCSYFRRRHLPSCQFFNTNTRHLNPVRKPSRALF